MFPEALTNLEKCKKSDYSEVIKSMRANLLKIDINLNERSTRIWKEIDVGGNDFNRKKNLIEALDKLDRSKVDDLFKKIFYKNPKRFSVHNYASNVKSFEPESSNSSIDLKEFHLNKKLKIKYTEDLNFLKDAHILQKIKAIRTKANKFKAVNSNTKNNLLNSSENKSRVKTNKVKNKVKNVKIITDNEIFEPNRNKNKI